MARLGRSQPFTPHLPELGAPQPVKRGTFVLQSLRRPYVGRTTPEPHLAPPVPAVPFVAPQATIVSAHVLRHSHFVVPPSTILPAPIFLAPVARYATIVSLGAAALSRRLRNVIGTILPPPTTGQTPVPAGTFVGLGPAERIRRRRYLYSTLVAPPVLATAAFIAPAPVVIQQARVGRRSRGAVSVIRWGASAPPVPRGTFFNQSVQRAITRRTVSKPHLAAPVTQVPGFIAPPATIVSSHFLRRRVRSVPPSTILPTVTFYAPVARYSNFVSLGAVTRPKRLRNIAGTLLPPSIVGRKPLPVGSITSQATRRPYVGRQSPNPHLAPPVIPVVKFIAPAAIITSDQARERPWRGRSVPLHALVAPPLVGAAPVLASLIVTNTVFHAPGPDKRYLRVQRPLLAKPVVRTVPFLAPAPLVVSQAVERSTLRRSGAVRLPRRGSPTPVPVGAFSYQAIQRSRLGRGPNPRPHLAASIVAPPVPFRSAGFLNLQAVQRAQGHRYRDVPPEPHLAPPVATPAGPGATIKLQSLARQLRRREGRVHLPVLGDLLPVPRGTFVPQAGHRPFVGRTVPAPHLALPIVPLPVAFLAPATKIVSQAVERAVLRRSGSVKLPVLGASRPVPRGTFVDQAIQRPLRGRTVPAPHLALGVVAPKPVPPNAPGTFIEQAVERSVSLVSRRGHVRLAPPVLTKGRIPPTLVVSQAQQRPYIGRKVIPPHLAPPVRTKAGPGAHLYYQAVQRVLRRRTIPLHPKYAGPLVKPPPAPISAFPIVFLQAISRMYIGRKVPPSPSVRYHPIVFTPSQPSIPFPSITTIGTTGKIGRTGITWQSSSTKRGVLGSSDMSARESIWIGGVYPSQNLFPSRRTGQGTISNR